MKSMRRYEFLILQRMQNTNLNVRDLNNKKTKKKLSSSDAIREN